VGDHGVALASHGTQALIGFGTGVLTARVLGPAGRGELAAILVWVNSLVAAGFLAMPQAYTYFAGQYPSQRTQLWRLASRHALLQGVLVAFVSAGVVYIALHSAYPNGARVGALFALSAPLTFLVGARLGVLLGAGRIRAWNLLRVAQSFVYLACLGAFAITGLSVKWVLLSQALAVVAVGFLTQLTRIANAPATDDAPVRSVGLRRIIAFGAATTLGLLSNMANSHLDQMLMALLIPPAALGQYAVAASLSLAILPIADAIATVAFSRMAQTKTDEGRTEISCTHLPWVFWTLLVVGGSASALARPLIIVAFGSEYQAAVLPFRILAIAVAFLGASHVAGPLLQGAGRPMLSSWGSFVGAVVTVIGLLVLLPIWGIVGAAVASLCAYVATMITMYVGLARIAQVSVWRLLVPTSMPLRSSAES